MYSALRDLGTSHGRRLVLILETAIQLSYAMSLPGFQEIFHKYRTLATSMYTTFNEIQTRTGLIFNLIL